MTIIITNPDPGGDLSSIVSAIHPILEVSTRNLWGVQCWYIIDLQTGISAEILEEIGMDDSVHNPFILIMAVIENRRNWNSVEEEYFSV